MSVNGPTTRREFLKTTGTTALGALAMTAIVPSSALGADGTIPPSERLVIGCIGIGKMCNGHLGGLLNNKSVQLAAVCDVDSEHLTKAASSVWNAAW